MQKDAVAMRYVVLQRQHPDKGHGRRGNRQGHRPLLMQKGSMDLITTWRHLFSAVLRLGSDQGTVDERLREAYRGSLSQIPNNPGLPVSLHKDYEQLMAELADLFNGADPVDAKRASRLAKQVVAIYDRVAKEVQ